MDPSNLREPICGKNDADDVDVITDMWTILVRKNTYLHGGVTQDLQSVQES